MTGMWEEGEHPDSERGKRPEKCGEDTAHGGWVGCIAGVGGGKSWISLY